MVSRLKEEIDLALVVDPDAFACGHCKKPINNIVEWRLPCDIHFACSPACKRSPCNICCCDGCGKPANSVIKVLNCGCYYDEGCFVRIQPDANFNFCKHCEEFREEPGKGSYLPGIITSIDRIMYGSRQAAFLSPYKFNKLTQLRGWKATDFLCRPAYTAETFARSGVPFQRLLEIGMDCEALKKAGFTFELMLRAFSANSALEKSDLHKVFSVFQPGLKELTASVKDSFFPEEKEDIQKKVLGHIKKNMNITFQELSRIKGIAEKDFTSYAPRETWYGVFNYKEVELVLKGEE